MNLSFNDGWKLKWFDENEVSDSDIANLRDLQGWLHVEVPGDVHSTLLKNGVIEDPFFSTNVEKCRWIEDKIWWYKKEFNFDKELSKDEIVELKFEGLDTYATVYLNGEVLGSHENMFTPAVFNVTGKLNGGLNTLSVKFDSVMSVTDKKDYSRMWYSYNPNRAWVRKAQMNFRWDWGPRILTVGIWKDVILTTHKIANIESVFVRTTKITGNYAELSIDVESRNIDTNAKLEAEINFTDGQKSIVEKIQLQNGQCSTIIKVDNPKLWWTFDLGEPFLYDFNVKLKSGDSILDEYNTKVGIRTVEVKQKNERGDNRFTFVLNGVETFSKGANWIPAHNFIGAIKDETYIRWIAMAVEGNMNMLRVWGGGIYEKDIFYRECDKAGILVWQDFMFACSSYPDFDADFMNNVKEEIIYVVKSLRNYTCLAIWCGNNEIQWIHGQKMPDLKDMRLYGEKIYHDLMPELLEKLDPSRLYWPSSPFGGNDPNSDDEGDKHNWQVWAGQVYPHKQGERMLSDNTTYGISFKRFATDMGRFVSEFGMHALPVKETLKNCIPEKDLYFGSFEMRFRNKDKRPNRGKLLMEGYTGLPTNLDDYIDFSMLAQAEGLKFGIEHYRRRFPECSGAVIWQINDCWPTMSWSIVDHYYRPKAGFYYTKRVFKPILLSFKEEGPDTVSLWVTNDTMQEYKDALEIGLRDFFGSKEFGEVINVSVAPNTSIRVRELSKNRMNLTYSNFEFLYVIPKNKSVDYNIMFFEDYKDLNLPDCSLKYESRMLSDNRVELRIRTDHFARFVRITCGVDNIKFSDNYFDMMPGQERTIIIEGINGNIPEPENIEVTVINQN